MGFFSAIPIVGELFSIGKTYLEGVNERKRAKIESDREITKAVTQAKIKKMETAQEADIAWENLSIENAGWKDEFWTIILAIPMVLAFIPGMAGYVHQGFSVLQGLPEWYRWALSIAIGSAFGVKKFTDFMRTRKGA